MAWYTHKKSVEGIKVKVKYWNGEKLKGVLAYDGTLISPDYDVGYVALERVDGRYVLGTDYRGRHNVKSVKRIK